MNISHYLTQFSKGELTPVDAYAILKCDTEYFFEQCTGKKFNDASDEEFNEYMNALHAMQAHPWIRNRLKKVALPFQLKLEAELYEECRNVQEEFEEFEYRRAIEIY